MQYIGCCYIDYSSIIYLLPIVFINRVWICSFRIVTIHSIIISVCLRGTVANGGLTIRDPNQTPEQIKLLKCSPAYAGIVRWGELHT